jgi:hypothetical protein
MTTTETKQQQEQIQLFGQAYRNFADSIHSPATKGSYDFALCRYTKHLKVQTVDVYASNTTLLLRDHVML